MSAFSWVTDNWFGMDPGGGDIKDAAAAGVTEMKKYYGESEDILKDYYSQILNEIGQQYNSMVKYYDQGLQQGMNAYDSMNQSAMKAYEESTSRASSALTEGAKLAQSTLTQYYDQSKKQLEAVGAAPTFGEYDSTAYMNDPEYQRRREAIIRDVKEFAAMSGAEGMTDDLAAIANEEITKLNSEFGNQYFNRAQTLFGNELSAYDRNTNAALQQAGLTQGLGTNISNIQLGTSQSQAGLEQDLGMRRGDLLGDAAKIKLGANLDQGANLANAAELQGAGRISAIGTQGTNLANLKRELGAATSDIALNTGLAAADAERQHESASNELFGTLIGYRTDYLKSKHKK